MTNGGGKHESARVAELSKKLNVPLTEENFVQSHTPFKQLVEESGTTESLKDKTVLVTGGDGDKCRKVAEMLVPFSPLSRLLCFTRQSHMGNLSEFET